MDDRSETATRFIENPESISLFRGERVSNLGGLHFTDNEEWAGCFGTTILTGKLPSGSRIRLLVETDMATALANGIYSEQGLWDVFFAQGYDAILGYDSMRPKFLDVIVHPKHLERFAIKRSGN